MLGKFGISNLPLATLTITVTVVPDVVETAECPTLVTDSVMPGVLAASPVDPSMLGTAEVLPGSLATEGGNIVTVTSTALDESVIETEGDVCH